MFAHSGTGWAEVSELGRGSCDPGVGQRKANISSHGVIESGAPGAQESGVQDYSSVPGAVLRGRHL